MVAGLQTPPHQRTTRTQPRTGTRTRARAHPHPRTRTCTRTHTIDVASKHSLKFVFQDRFVIPVPRFHISCPFIVLQPKAVVYFPVRPPFLPACLEGDAPQNTLLEPCLYSICKR